MSLAEPRRKTKWSVDPNNSSWSNDKGKYGLKLMEKMGWSDGKGLGRNLHGTVSHIGVRMKKDNRGIGANNDVDFNWLETQDMFSSMLTDLNEKLGQPGSSGATADAIKAATASTAATAGTDAAKPRRGTRAAMFYGRFKRSKDLSGYTESDMSQVLGMAEARPDRLVPKAEEDAPRTEAEASVDDVGFKTVTSTLSISDYFKLKKTGAAVPSALDMVLKGASSEDKNTSKANSDADDADDDDSEALNFRPSFGVGGGLGGGLAGWNSGFTLGGVAATKESASVNTNSSSSSNDDSSSSSSNDDDDDDDSNDSDDKASTNGKEVAKKAAKKAAKKDAKKQAKKQAKKEAKKDAKKQAKKQAKAAAAAAAAEAAVKKPVQEASKKSKRKYDSDNVDDEPSNKKAKKAKLATGDNEPKKSKK